MKIFSFEKLKVWQKSRQLSSKVYKITKLFPDDERFGLIAQMRRCAISISSNVAEGTGRHSAKDKARFTEIAFGSALELLNQTKTTNILEQNYRKLQQCSMRYENHNWHKQYKNRIKRITLIN